jgi:hypothetical protein
MMENRIVAETTDRISNQRTLTKLNLLNKPIDLKSTSDAIGILIAEGGENFYNYVDWLGLVKDPNLVVLSSLHHYYYDAEEMNNVKTVVNLKELNQIKQIKSFLHSSVNILPENSNLIGCFIDNKKNNGYVLRNNSSIYYNKRSFDNIENDIVSQIPFLNMLYGLMDSKINNYLDKKSVSILLESLGCKVMDMTELNGLTYFHSQKVRNDYN